MELALRLGRALLRAIPGKRREACLARIQTQSLSRALQELGLSALCADLARIVPDLRHQYTDVVLDTD